MRRPYAATHPAPKVRERGDEMTVGIGLLCSDGKDGNRILLAADMRASYGPRSSNDQTAKLTELPRFYAAAFAGTISQCEDVIAELHHQME